MKFNDELVNGDEGEDTSNCSCYSHEMQKMNQIEASEEVDLIPKKFFIRKIHCRSDSSKNPAPSPKPEPKQNPKTHPLTDSPDLDLNSKEVARKCSPDKRSPTIKSLKERKRTLAPSRKS